MTSSSSSRASMSLQRVGSSTGIISLALEAEIDECERLLSSGKIPLGNTANGSDNPYEVTVRPFLEAFEAEFDRISTSIRQGETAIIGNAQALLLSVDAMQRTVSSSTDVHIDAQDIQTLRDKAASLSNRVLKLNFQTVSLRHVMVATIYCFAVAAPLSSIDSTAEKPRLIMKYE